MSEPTQLPRDAMPVTQASSLSPTHKCGPMLEKWADKVKDRRVIGDFWTWLCEHNAALRVINIYDELDKYHGIDAAQLEKERNALLHSIRHSEIPS